MRIGGQRRSSNIEDRRGSGGGGGLGGGGLGGGGLPFRIRGLGLGGIIIIGVILFLMPAPMRNMILSQVLGGGGQSAMSSSEPGAQGCPQGDQACDFVSVILGSTEDVWAQQFSQNRLPNYGRGASAYENPTLVLFQGQVSTACGVADSSVGPFYCPGDRKLYIDLSFYDVMASRLNAPGDFAQAYVIAHEVGHHVQNLIGATQQSIPGESQNQTSVRVELQADCFAGVWGHSARADLALDDADLREALNAAHSIGDDTLQRGSQGYVTPASFTHGTSAQRMAWFRRGFDSGDARHCDTFAERDYSRL